MLSTGDHVIPTSRDIFLWEASSGPTQGRGNVTLAHLEHQRNVTLAACIVTLVAG